MNKFIVIIRPEFMSFCQDACRAAAFNHLLFRIAGKSKDMPQEKIIAGDILWYAKNEQIVEEMQHAWGLCKIRQEVNKLVAMGLIGRKNNPEWGADRTKHFCFGEKECRKFLEYLQTHEICFVHLELPDEMKHLIYSSNANDKTIKCICQNHQMETIDVSNANDESIEAITIDRHTKIDSKERDTYVTSANAESDAPAYGNVITYEDGLKRKTEPRMPAIKIGAASDDSRSTHSDNLAHSSLRVDGGDEQSSQQTAATTQRGVQPTTTHTHGDDGGHTPTTPVIPQQAPSSPSSDDANRNRRVGDGSRASRKAKKPAFELTAEQQRFWDLWCNVWFNKDIPPEMTDIAYSHVRKLAPHILDGSKLDKLIDYTRKDLAESQGIKRKTVQLGNLVHSYPGWIQSLKAPVKPTTSQADEYGNDYSIAGMLARQQARAAN